MADLQYEKIQPYVRERVEPFFQEVLKENENIHSLHVVGSAVTEDFIEGISDINSVIILKEMDLAFLDRLAPLGKKYRKKNISAPMIMTPEYIRDSLDVFPIEFLSFKLVHQTVLGPDVLAAVEIDREHLRLQCEREIKSKLIWLRQGYISSMGDRKLITGNIANSITGYVPLFRGILLLAGKESPPASVDIIREIGALSHAKTDIFQKIFDMKHKKFTPSGDELHDMFKEYYDVSEAIGRMINDLAV